MVFHCASSVDALSRFEIRPDNRMSLRSSGHPPPQQNQPQLRANEIRHTRGCIAGMFSRRIQMASGHEVQYNSTGKCIVPFTLQQSRGSMITIVTRHSIPLFASPDSLIVIRVEY